MRRSIHALLAVSAALVAYLDTPARADEVTGTWTGSVEVLGNYYWERSTRVVAPDVELRLQSPRGVDLQAGYLIDAITSASQAAGALTDNRFTEVRHDVSLGGGYEWNLEASALRFGASLRLSREPDYTSASGGVSFALSLDDRSTVLRLDLGILHDEVRQTFRGGTGVRPGDDGTSADAFAESLDAFRVGVGWEQVLSPRTLFTVGYELTYVEGFLANPYRLVPVAGVLRAETHPDDRLRHTLSGRLAHAVPRTGTALHLLYRAYVDSWRIAAVTPETRIYQRLTQHALLRVRYRHYRQSRAFFFQPDPADYTANDRFVSADPKMSEFHSHLLGFQVGLGLGFLDGTVLSRLAPASLALDLEYIWNTSRYGNGVIAQIGATMPF